MTNATRLLVKANKVVLNALVTLQNDYLDSKATKDVSKQIKISSFGFEGDKEYFLALQSSEKNGEGGELSREVHDGCKKDQSHGMIEKCKKRCWLPMLVVAEQARGEILQVTIPPPLPPHTPPIN